MNEETEVSQEFIDLFKPYYQEADAKFLRGELLNQAYTLISQIRKDMFVKFTKETISE